MNKDRAYYLALTIDPLWILVGIFIAMFSAGQLDGNSITDSALGSLAFLGYYLFAIIAAADITRWYCNRQQKKVLTQNKKRVE